MWNERLYFCLSLAAAGVLLLAVAAGLNFYASEATARAADCPELLPHGGAPGMAVPKLPSGYPPGQQRSLGPACLVRRSSCSCAILSRQATPARGAIAPAGAADIGSVLELHRIAQNAVPRRVVRNAGLT